MLDDHDRPPGGLPHVDQFADPLLGLGVVALAPERGVLEALLDVDDDQDGVGVDGERGVEGAGVRHASMLRRARAHP